MQIRAIIRANFITIRTIVIDSDGISRLLEHVGLRARTFYSGPLCGLHNFHAGDGAGHLHVVRAGFLNAEQSGHEKISIEEPTLLFYPRPIDHRLDAPPQVTASVLCASVNYEAGMENAITQSFPVVIAIPFRLAKGIEPTLNLLFSEAGEVHPGRHAMLDRLCDVLLIQIVRYVIENSIISNGVLAGLAHPRLGKTMSEILDNPGQSWTLDDMAAVAHQSRTAFARNFRETIGATPADFLTKIRIGHAQRLLIKGKSLATVAQMVGYGSQPAFSRAFIRETGNAPSDWLRQQS